MRRCTKYLVLEVCNLGRVSLFFGPFSSTTNVHLHVHADPHVFKQEDYELSGSR